MATDPRGESHRAPGENSNNKKKKKERKKTEEKYYKLLSEFQWLFGTNREI